MLYKVVLQKSEEGYSVSCPALPGCWSQGETEDEAIGNIKDAIEDLPLQFILDQCYAQSNTTLCNFITRRPAVQGPNNSGSLDEVNSARLNSGGLQTSGIDATLSYRYDFGDVKTNIYVAYTHLFRA